VVKDGLGRAYKEAVSYVFDHAPDTDILCWMDADLSHNPKYLPCMMQLLGECDMVIGSRYIRNGGVKNWNWYRRLLSRGGNFYARTVSGLKVRDCTAGFMMFRSHVLRTMDFDSFDAQGYSFLIEVKASCQNKGYNIKEYPIIFEERREGISKLTAGIITEALWNVWRIRYKKRHQRNRFEKSYFQ
jgi:dolichol-phosphate mannosyltransferase